jgi:hypothetical protein
MRYETRETLKEWLVGAAVIVGCVGVFLWFVVQLAEAQ